MAAVIGVGSPIGRQTALTFAGEGAEVLAVDRHDGAAASVVDEIEAHGGAAAVLAVDYMSEDGIAAIVAECDARWRRLDIVFNGHAAMDFWSPGEASATEWAQILHANVVAPTMTTTALMPLLRASGSASVIFLGTIDGLRGMPELPGYSTSKGALVPLTHLMAAEHGPAGVRVNCIATAAIVQVGPQDLHQAVWREQGTDEQIASRVIDFTPLRRLCEPSDVASVALFFASEDSAYVTGTVLPVDGGRIAYTPLDYGRRP